MAFLLGATAAAESVDLGHGTEVVVLDGAWKFHPGDDPTWARLDLDASSWEEVNVPSSWTTQGFGGVETAWLRREMTLVDPPEGELALRLTRVDSSYEVFAGGELIGAVGSLPPSPKPEPDRWAVFTVPQSAIAADGTLVLALRVWRLPVTPEAGGVTGLAPALGNSRVLQSRNVVEQLSLLILAVVLITLGLFYLIFSVGQRSDRQIGLWLALLALDAAVLTFLGSQWRFLLGDSYAWLKEGEHLALFLLPVLWIQLLGSLSSGSVGVGFRLYQLSFFLVVLAGLTPGLALNFRLLPWWKLWLLPLVVWTLVLLARRAVSRVPDSLTMGAGFVALSGAVVLDAAQAWHLVQGPYFLPFGLGIFVLSMAVSLANCKTRDYRELDELRLSLGQRIEDRTRELSRVNQRLQEVDRSKSAFLANMSHEIRTPLNGIIGMSELLLKADLDLVQREYATTIASSGSSLLSLIDDILDFSKIEAGKLRLQEVDFQLRNTVKSVLELLAPRARDKNLQLQIEVGEGLPGRFRGDPARLRQVLLNLVGNAVKFTEIGRVRVRLEKAKAEKDRLWVKFSVADTGVGISEEEQRQLFSAFTQADSSSAREYGGTGLGLAISKSIVELMGGQIGVRSKPGVGSVFSFTLPFAPPRLAATKETRNQNQDVNSRQRGTLSILVAEDNPINQMVTLRQLRALGFRAEAVANGVDVLAAMNSKRFDLILMDCQMPRLDGYETTRRIRQRERGGARTPVIAVTAHAMKGDRERCLAAGMDDYISKPFREQDLAALLDRWLLDPDRDGERPKPSSGQEQKEPLSEVLDPKILQGLEKLGDSSGENVLNRVSAMFLEEVPRRLKAIRAAASSGDLSAIEHAAHSLKGSAGILGASSFLKRSHELELAARARTTNDQAEMIRILEVEYRRVAEELRKRLDSSAED